MGIKIIDVIMTAKSQEQKAKNGGTATSRKYHVWHFKCQEKPICDEERQKHETTSFVLESNKAGGLYDTVIEQVFVQGFHPLALSSLWILLKGHKKKKLKEKRGSSSKDMSPDAQLGLSLPLLNQIDLR